MFWSRVASAQFSPDGQWIAYNTDESSQHEVKVVPFPPTGEEYPISTDGGVQPTWRRDGQELYFLTMNGYLKAVDFRPGNEFEIGNIRTLFQTSLTAEYEVTQYAPDPSGERFLLLLPYQDSTAASFNVILNWSSLLEK